MFGKTGPTGAQTKTDAIDLKADIEVTECVPLLSSIPAATQSVTFGDAPSHLSLAGVQRWKSPKGI